MSADPRFLRALARLAAVEAASLVLLLGVKAAGAADAVTLIGALHGAVWLLYAWLILAMIWLKMWNRKEAARLVICALLPGGGFVTARWCRKLLLQDPLRQHQ